MRPNRPLQLPRPGSGAIVSGVMQRNQKRLQRGVVGLQNPQMQALIGLAGGVAQGGRQVCLERRPSRNTNIKPMVPVWPSAYGLSASNGATPVPSVWAAFRRISAIDGFTAALHRAPRPAGQR